MDERRVTPRWQINQQAELTVENGVKPIPCVVEDISYRGMRICLKRNLFDDVFSNFRLALGAGFEFDLNASVAWRTQTDEQNIYGLSFNRIEDSLKHRIWDHIKNNFPNLLAKHWWEGA